jgi:hypothetical protein
LSQVKPSDFIPKNIYIGKNQNFVRKEITFNDENVFRAKEDDRKPQAVPETKQNQKALVALYNSSFGSQSDLLKTNFSIQNPKANEKSNSNGSKSGMKDGDMKGKDGNGVANPKKKNKKKKSKGQAQATSKAIDELLNNANKMIRNNI